MDSFIERFVTDLKEIDEHSDYGDFMRKANRHIIELRNRVHPLHYQDVEHAIDEIQNYVQFVPTWMIESTRARAIHDAAGIDLLLQAHRDFEGKIMTERDE